MDSVHVVRSDVCVSPVAVCHSQPQQIPFSPHKRQHRPKKDPNWARYQDLNHYYSENSGKYSNHYYSGKDFSGNSRKDSRPGPGWKDNCPHNSFAQFSPNQNNNSKHPYGGLENVKSKHPYGGKTWKMGNNQGQKRSPLSSRFLNKLPSISSSGEDDSVLNQSESSSGRFGMEAKIEQENAIRPSFGHSPSPSPRPDDFKSDVTGRGAKNRLRTRNRPKFTRKTTASPTFDEKYELLGEVLGHGAYAEVRACRERDTGLECAVKIIPRHWNTSDRDRAHGGGHDGGFCENHNEQPFGAQYSGQRSHDSGYPQVPMSEDPEQSRVLKEVRLFQLARGQENVLQLLDFFQEHDRYLLVMERMRGGSLQEAVASCSTRLDEASAARIAHQLATALSFLHSHGVAHRDLKPQNVLCSHPDLLHLSSVKISDFDLGSTPPAQESIWDGSGSDNSDFCSPQFLTPVGSLEYMAPEVLKTWIGEARKYDKKCDCWSLGVITYWLLSGCMPFMGGQCGSATCGWEKGDDCPACQKMVSLAIKDGRYELTSAAWADVSSGAKDMVSGLLVRDPARRLTVDQVLAHPWIREHTQTQTETQTQLPKTVALRDRDRDRSTKRISHYDSGLPSTASTLDEEDELFSLDSILPIPLETHTNTHTPGFQNTHSLESANLQFEKTTSGAFQFEKAFEKTSSGAFEFEKTSSGAFEFEKTGNFEKSGPFEFEKTGGISEEMEMRTNRRRQGAGAPNSGSDSKKHLADMKKDSLVPSTKPAPIPCHSGQNQGQWAYSKPLSWVDMLDEAYDDYDPFAE